ncbi:MAG: polymer-forming cytoskeletal protein [Coprobacillus sp.]
MGKPTTFKDKVINRYFEPNDESNDYNQKEITNLYEEDIEISNDFKQEVAVVTNPTIISNGTEIEGNINVQGKLEIFGKVTGDICVTESLVIHGAQIVGNIKADRILIEKSLINGNVSAKSSVNMHEGSQIVGQIKAHTVDLNGECHGNIYVDELLHLMSLSHVEGDVCAKKLIIDEGSVVDGQVKMKK